MGVAIKGMDIWYIPVGVTNFQTILSCEETEFDLCGIFSMILLTACEQVARFMKKPFFSFQQFLTAVSFR